MRNWWQRIKSILVLYLYTKPKVNFVWFKREKALLSGSSQPLSDQQSIIVFTVHKCASSFISQSMRDLALSADVLPIDLDAYFTMTDDSRYQLYKDDRFLQQAFRKKGYYYGPFRSYRPIPDLDQYKVVLILRDPRDVLVSQYYSAAYNHPVINRKILTNRKEILKKSIDEHVVVKADDFVTIYREYCDKLLHQDYVLFLRYEEMVSEFENWLNRLTAFTGTNSHPETVRKILDGTSFKVDKENKFQFKRQVNPGNYKKQLNPETINVLNEKFKDILPALGYSV